MAEVAKNATEAMEQDSAKEEESEELIKEKKGSNPKKRNKDDDKDAGDSDGEPASKKKKRDSNPDTEKEVDKIMERDLAALKRHDPQDRVNKHCGVCKVFLQNIAMTITHYEGSKHRSKLLSIIDFHNRIISSGGKVVQSMKYCEVCNMILTNRNSNAHYKSKDHMKKMLIAYQDYDDYEDIEFLYCEFCDIKMETPEQMNKHMKGVKHRNVIHYLGEFDPMAIRNKLNPKKFLNPHRFFKRRNFNRPPRDQQGFFPRNMPFNLPFMPQLGEMLGNAFQFGMNRPNQNFDFTSDSPFPRRDGRWPSGSRNFRDNEDRPDEGEEEEKREGEGEEKKEGEGEEKKEGEGENQDSTVSSSENILPGNKAPPHVLLAKEKEKCKGSQPKDNESSKSSTLSKTSTMIPPSLIPNQPKPADKKAGSNTPFGKPDNANAPHTSAAGPSANPNRFGNQKFNQPTQNKQIGNKSNQNPKRPNSNSSSGLINDPNNRTQQSLLGEPPINLFNKNQGVGNRNIGFGSSNMGRGSNNRNSGLGGNNSNMDSPFNRNRRPGANNRNTGPGLLGQSTLGLDKLSNDTGFSKPGLGSRFGNNQGFNNRNRGFDSGFGARGGGNQGFNNPPNKFQQKPGFQTNSQFGPGRSNMSQRLGTGNRPQGMPGNKRFGTGNNQGFGSQQNFGGQNDPTQNYGNDPQQFENQGQGYAFQDNFSDQGYSTQDFTQSQGYSQDMSQGQSFSQDMSQGQGYSQDISQSQGFSQDMSQGQGYPQDMSQGQGFSQDMNQGYTDQSYQQENYGTQEYMDQGYNETINQGQGYGSSNNQGQGYGPTNNQGQGYGPTNNQGQGYGPSNNQGQGYGSTNNQGQGYGSTNNQGQGYGPTNNQGQGYGEANNQGQNYGAVNNQGQDYGGQLDQSQGGYISQYNDPNSQGQSYGDMSGQGYTDPNNQGYGGQMDQSYGNQGYGTGNQDNDYNYTQSTDQYNTSQVDPTNQQAGYYDPQLGAEYQSQGYDQSGAYFNQQGQQAYSDSRQQNFMGNQM